MEAKRRLKVMAGWVLETKEEKEKKKKEKTKDKRKVIEDSPMGVKARWYKVESGYMSYIGWRGISNDLASTWGLDPQFCLEHS